MTKEAFALVALALLISLNQWIFARTVARIGPQLVHGPSRRRVQWMLQHSAVIHLTSAAVLTVGLALQATALVR